MLRDLEERLDVELALRGNRLTLTGMEPRVRAGAEVVGQLAEMVLKGHPIAPGTIESVADAVEGAEAIGPILDDVVWRNGRFVVTPRTAGQSATSTASGRARSHSGSAPRHRQDVLAVAIATAALMRREVARIILTRPRWRPASASASCPGTWPPRSTRTFAPCSTPSTTCSTPERVEALFDRGQVEVAPLAFMRGRS